MAKKSNDILTHSQGEMQKVHNRKKVTNRLKGKLFLPDTQLVSSSTDSVVRKKDNRMVLAEKFNQVLLLIEELLVEATEEADLLLVKRVALFLRTVLKLVFLCVQHGQEPDWKIEHDQLTIRLAFPWHYEVTA